MCASSLEKVEVLHELQTQPRNIHARLSPVSCRDHVFVAVRTKTSAVQAAGDVAVE